MWLPQELAMLVGSYLDAGDLRVCTTQLCSSGAGFVANLFKNDSTTIRLHELVACCRLSVSVDDVAQECIERVESFVKRRVNVQTIVLHAKLRGERATSASVYPNFHRRLQQASSFQLSQNQEITVEWRVSAESIEQVGFLLNVDMPKDGARASGSSACGPIRQSLHTLDLRETDVSDVSALASCQSLHTLNLAHSRVSDVSALASCQSLHTLNLAHSRVSDVSALASCQSLHTLHLACTEVSDVSALVSCQNLHTLNLSCTHVSDVSVLASWQSLHTLDLADTELSDVSALASCEPLHTLDLSETRVRDVSALASCRSLHTLNLKNTRVRDVTALASCQSLRKLSGVRRMIGNTNVLRIIQNRG
jgi:hypothetical protein